MFAPKGSKTPVWIPVSWAIVEIIFGLNWGSEKIQLIDTKQLNKGADAALACLSLINIKKNSNNYEWY